MQHPAVIAIDGPAGSGKSTLGALLAQQLGYVYFDTGVMYRALTVVALQQQLDLHDAAALATLAQRTQIEVLPPTIADGRQYTVLANGQDITPELRQPVVDQHVSFVAIQPDVRSELVRQQRAIGTRGQVVMVGRDIGTVVMPDAPLKIYLSASLPERARRRHAQHAQQHPDALERIAAELARRDQLDAHVLQPASDAILINTDHLSPEEEVERVLALWRQECTAAAYPTTGIPAHSHSPE